MSKSALLTPPELNTQTVTRVSPEQNKHGNATALWEQIKKVAVVWESTKGWCSMRTDTWVGIPSSVYQRRHREHTGQDTAERSSRQREQRATDKRRERPWDTRQGWTGPGLWVESLGSDQRDTAGEGSSGPPGWPDADPWSGLMPPVQHHSSLSHASLAPHRLRWLHADIHCLLTCNSNHFLFCSQSVSPPTLTSTPHRQVFLMLCSLI